MNLPATILDVQLGLQRLGFSVDADSAAGPQTWGALRDFILRVSPQQPAAVSTASPGPAARSESADSGAVKNLAQPVSERSRIVIATLLPEVQPYAVSLIHMASQQGLTIEILSGTRSYPEQNALYAQGRTAPGKVVTNARAGFSNHNFGIAFDTGIFLDGKYADDMYEKRQISGAQLEKMYSALGAIGKGMGLTWGGDWTSIQDQPHFELKPAWAKNMNETALLTELRARHERGEDVFA